MRKAGIIFLVVGILGGVCCAGIAIYEGSAILMGQILFQEGYKALTVRDYKKAISLFDEALKEPATQPRRAAALADRGWCKHWLGKRQEAIADYSAALDLNPELFFAVENRGYAYDQLGDTIHAAADYEAALKLNPNLAYIWTRLGTFARNQGDYARARQDFREAIRSYPNYVSAYVESGETSRLLKDREGAIASFEAALRIDSKSAAAYAGLGRLYRDELKYDLAVTALSKAVSLMPKDRSYRYLRALTNMDEERYQKVIDDSSALIQFDGHDERAWQLRGVAYRELKKFGLALEDFARFIDLTKSADAYDDRARTYSKSGQYALALSDYVQAQKLGRGKVRTRSRSMAWFLATCPDPKFRDAAKAVEQARKDCEKSEWNSLSALDALAAAEAEAGNFEEAECYEEAALKLGANYPRWERGLRLRRAMFEQHQPFRDNMED